MLDQSDIAHYLLSVGLVKPRDVVEEDLTVSDVSRRNVVFLASTRAGPTYVIKQAWPRSAGTLSHEAAVLRVLARFPALASQLPRVLVHEPEDARLVLGTPAGARDWVVHHGGGRFPRITPRVLGRTLAALQRIPVEALGAVPEAQDAMWGLTLPEPSREMLLELSAGAHDLVARLQASDAVCARLHDLRNARSEDALVHGDLRWDNCLAVAPTGASRRTRLLLIDWELAGPGTAGFDAGTVLAEYLRVWVGSIPIVDPADPRRLVAHARVPLWRMHPAMQAFWSSYRSAGACRPSLRRVVELAAVRLLQTAIEHTQGLGTPSAHVVTLVQLADNMLRDPDGAALALMALRE